MTQAHYIVGDTRQVTATLPDGCVDLVLTSPPFLALRSYLPADHPDKANEIGSEPTPAAFLDVLLELTAQWGRVLAPHGSIAVELGDTFSGSGGAGGDYAADGWREGQEQFSGIAHRSRNQPNGAWPLAKSLALVPELYRVALAYGINPLTGQESPAGRWRVRNVVRWHRPNPPVGALGDKYRPATTDIVIATRAKDRWFDLDAVRNNDQREPSVQAPLPKALAAETIGHHGKGMPSTGTWHANGGAPPLDTWVIPTHPYKGAHYATWPPALCEIPIKSMCPLEVCRRCGTPRRRITGDRRRFLDAQPEIARHIRERREAAGVTSDDLNRELGYKWIAKNWERTDPHGAAIPSPRDWAYLIDRIGVDDTRYGHVVRSDRKWHESHVEYIDGDRQTITEKRTKFDRGGVPTDGVATLATRHAPHSWSDCGCDSPTYQPGVVLDPFAGTGTTLAVATGHGRNAIGIDIDPRNLHLANDRIGPLILTNGPELPDWVRP